MYYLIKAKRSRCFAMERGSSGMSAPETLARKKTPQAMCSLRRRAKNQNEAQRSGFDLKMKNNTIGQSDAACGG
jgi:hypothetical protein